MDYSKIRPVFKKVLTKRLANIIKYAYYDKMLNLLQIFAA